MSARLSSVFPRPAASDADDVVWTLQTAAVQWQRGLRADAIVWVRKAADLCMQVGRAARAEELRNQAARLAEFLWSDPQEPEVPPPSSAAAQGSAGRRIVLEDDDAEEIIEIEELDPDEIEFSDPDMPTPEDAVADVSPDDLRYYREGERADGGRPLPDDLDLGSDSMSPSAAASDSFVSISPEPESAGDSFISVHPDSDEEDADTYLEVNPESIPVAASSVPPALSDGPTLPRIEPPPEFLREAAGAVDQHQVPTVPPGPPSVDGLAFDTVEALADLPEEAHVELAHRANLVLLTSGEEFLLREGAVLITRGQVHVTLPFSDVSAERAGQGSVVPARGSVEAGPLRLIADAEEAHLVTWTDAQLARAMRDCPWVEDELRRLSDRLHAHASAGLGPLGERLDDALRAAVYERLQVRVLAPDEAVAERGKPLKGLFVVAVGELNVASDNGQSSLAAGQFVFPGCVIGAEPAPHDVKAGPKGGLVLFATRPVAHELMMSVPPLLEILAS